MTGIGKTAQPETWVLFVKERAMRVERVKSMGKIWLTWCNDLGGHPRTGRVNRGLVLGFFPTFEAADTAKFAARLAIQNVRGEASSELIAAKDAIKRSPGYRAAEPI